MDSPRIPGLFWRAVRATWQELVDNGWRCELVADAPDPDDPRGAVD